MRPETLSKFVAYETVNSLVLHGLYQPSTLSFIYTRFHTLKKTALGKNCGKR